MNKFSLQNLFSLEGKTALVTGGNGGLGLSMAKALKSAGATIAICGRQEKKLSEAGLELGKDASLHRVDLEDEDALSELIEAVVEAHGGLDILINNAGTSVRGAPETLSRVDFEKVLSVNTTSALRLSQLAYSHFVERGGGKIINIGSMFSNLGSPFSLPYAVSKGAILQLTRSLAIAWASENIQTNAILPGWFDTELTRDTRKHVPGLEQTICERTPTGRWGNPEDLSGTAVYLASKASDFITGACISVDGGFSVSM